MDPYYHPSNDLVVGLALMCHVLVAVDLPLLLDVQLSMQKAARLGVVVGLAIPVAAGQEEDEVAHLPVGELVVNLERLREVALVGACMSLWERVKQHLLWMGAHHQNNWQLFACVRPLAHGHQWHISSRACTRTGAAYPVAGAQSGNRLHSQANREVSTSGRRSSA